jgi:hypothetical protein
MSGAVEAETKLDINRVVRETVAVLRRNWRALVRPALLLLYLPDALAQFLSSRSASGGMFGGSVLALAASVLALAFYALFQGGLFRLAVADLNAEPISTDDALKVGRERMWTMVALMLLAGIGIAVGLVLLIVPGVLLALAWSVAGPVLIEERRPLLECFGRSAELTRRSRLNILALALLFLGVEIAAAVPCALVAAPFPRPFAAVLLWPLYSAVCATANGVGLAAVYEGLRRRSIPV